MLYENFFYDCIYSKNSKADLYHKFIYYCRSVGIKDDYGQRYKQYYCENVKKTIFYLTANMLSAIFVEKCKYWFCIVKLLNFL
ncbi:hypothetical protein AwWohl_02170 [Gammaproteobacteria bacterium]|nr:hypothetical protein AwWohl_02170 [Gammaproteobacteria bacterium]